MLVMCFFLCIKKGIHYPATNGVSVSIIRSVLPHLGLLNFSLKKYVISKEVS